jgi:predicted Zn-dependent protease
MEFQANYFESRTARPQLVRVLLQEPGFLTLQFPDGNLRRYSLAESSLFRLPGADKWSLNLDESGASLLLESKEYIRMMAAANPPWENAQSNHIQPSRRHFWTIVSVLLLLLGLFVAGLWFGTPLLADWAARHTDGDWEKKLGQEIQASVLDEFPQDTEKTRLLRQFYLQLEKDNPNLAEPVQLYFIKKEDFNAFAIPGGAVFVQQGAIDKMEHYAELAALLGHEIGHVEKRHTIRTLFRSASTYAVFSFFLGDLSGLSALVLDQAQNLRELSYSRDFEREADEAGMDFLCRNQIEGKGMVQLMQRMKKLDEGQTELAMLRSHPLTSERLENARQAVSRRNCPHRDQPELQTLFLQLKSRP